MDAVQSCMIGNVSGRQNIDCFFDLQLAVPKNLTDPELKEWRIVATPFSHDIKWHGQGHYFVWEDPDQAFRDPLNPHRWLLIHVSASVIGCRPPKHTSTVV